MTDRQKDRQPDGRTDGQRRTDGKNEQTERQKTMGKAKCIPRGEDIFKGEA